MEVKIYVDILFIINFIIDYILLSVTSFFVKKEAKIINTFASATVGATFSAVMFFAPIAIGFSITASFLAALLMIFIAFGKRPILAILKDTVCFYLVCALSGGLAFALVSKEALPYVINNGIFYADINAYSLLFALFTTAIIIHSATGYIRKQKIKSSYLYEVTIHRRGKTITDNAFFDSGNFLCDPITQRSVIVAEWQSVSPLFEEDKITEAIVNNPKDFVYIGCKSAFGVSGLYAFSPDEVTSDEINLPSEILIAVTETPLDKDGYYRLLLPNTAYTKKGLHNGHHF